MFIEELKRHLTVGSVHDIERLCQFDKDFWNVISLMSPSTPSRPPKGARRRIRLAFEDAENESEDGAWRVVCAADMARAFAFYRETEPEPIAIHCQAGMSRSTALALAFITIGYVEQESCVDKAVQMLTAIRPKARPNARVLELGLCQKLDKDDARSLTISLLNRPVLYRNRFGAEPEE